MVFQSRDRGSSSGCASDRSLDGFEESWQLSEEFFDAMVTGWKEEYSGLSSDHISVASKDDDGDGSLSSNGGSLWTEIRPTNHVAESEVEVRARKKQGNLKVCDRSQVRLGKEIGKGGQGTIYQATLDMPFSSQPIPVAVKKFKSLEGVSHGHHQKELWTVRNSHVCKPQGVFFDEDSTLCTVMELFSGDLRKIIDAKMRSSPDNDDRPPFLEPIALHLIMQVAMGLEYLHQLGIYHRDLKAENILVRNLKIPQSGLVGYQASIADFESSHHVVGTGFWRAPEVLQALEARTRLSDIDWQAADVYSFGMVCYEILTGKVPFSGIPFCKYEGVISGDRPELPDHVPGPLKEIICRCWHRDPGSRPNMTAVLESLKQTHEYTHEYTANLVREFTDRMEGVDRIVVNARTSASNLLLLKQIISKHMEINLHAKGGHVTHLLWASKFVATAEQFVSEFGWKSYQLHPSLPLAAYVERTRLACLAMQQVHRFASNAQYLLHYQFTDPPAWVDDLYIKEFIELYVRMRSIELELTEGLDLNCHPEMDEELLLSDKLTIVEAFVKRLITANVQQEAINTWLEHLLIEIDPEFSSPAVAEFHRRMRWSVRWIPVVVPWLVIAIESIILYLIYQALRNFSYSNYVLTYLGCGFRAVFLGWFHSKLDHYSTLFGPRLVPWVTLLNNLALISIAAENGYWKAFLTWVLLVRIPDMIRVIRRKISLNPRRPTEIQGSNNVVTDEELEMDGG